MLSYAMRADQSRAGMRVNQESTNLQLDLDTTNGHHQSEAIKLSTQVHKVLTPIADKLVLEKLEIQVHYTHSGHRL